MKNGELTPEQKARMYDSNIYRYIIDKMVENYGRYTYDLWMKAQMNPAFWRAKSY